MANHLYNTATYRWEMQGNNLVSIGNNDNPITFLEGSIVNGVFKDAQLKLAKPFNLLHDKEWALEWRMSGATTSTFAKIFDETGDEKGEGYHSISVRNGSTSISFSTHNGSTHVHYGVKLSEYGIDHLAEHLYRLENRVNADGTNMVWLYVDGHEIAPMRTRFTASGDYGPSDALSGYDFSFVFMGVPLYTLGGLNITDIAVWEEVPTTSEPLDPTSMLQGWMVGRAVASQRK